MLFGGSAFELDIKLKLLLEDLIQAGILATRERHGLSALHTFDNGAHYLDKHAFCTNINLDFKALASRPELVERTSDYINGYLSRERVTGLVDPDDFHAERTSLTLLGRLIRNTHLPFVNIQPQLAHTSLTLMPAVHTQELVDFWRASDSALGTVLVVFGTCRRHIQDDLNLPSRKYLALVSRDTLEQIDPEVRHQMIPHA